jgi:signal transduction histidine kinase
MPGRVVLAEFLEGLDLLFRDDLKKEGIGFELDLEDATLEIQADKNMLEQAFINLVKNSVEALKDRKDGLIKVKGSLPERTQVLLEISDNGPGMSPEIQSQIFIPFFTTKQKGTGIGLSIVRKIINMHGGNIHVSSLEGKGSTFVIRLPKGLIKSAGE